MFGTLTHLSDILELHDLMVLCGSFVISLVLLGLGQWIPMIFGGASRLAAVQGVHLKPTPRVGGVAIFLSLVVGVMLQSGEAVPTLGQFLWRHPFYSWPACWKTSDFLSLPGCAYWPRHWPACW